MQAPLRAVGIVLKDNKVLIMERNNKGRHYYTFIGGGVEDGEDVETAVVREVKEESSLEVRVKKLLYTVTYNQVFKERSGQRIYLCKYISGEPHLGSSPEKEKMIAGDNYYKPQWIAIEDIPHLPLFPFEIRDLLMQDIKNNFADCPRAMYVEAGTYRHTP